jgi:flavin reductase (DIM6/NTAB) family NADH-FMN oxidoreductase RutF
MIFSFHKRKEKSMSKIEIEKNAFVYPMPMVVVGTMVSDRPNFMAVGWVSRVNFNPPMISIALGKPHYTNGGIKKSRAFSINVPGKDLLEKVDYSGLVSGQNVDKSKLFTVVLGRETGAPMIEECPVCMECRLAQIVELPTNELFIGEIIGAYADEGCCTDGRPDIVKISPFTLTMPDNRYWAVGAEAGKAWGAGKRLKR